MALSEQQEQEIYPLLDEVLELELGKALLYKCVPSRANYLTRIIRGLRYDLAMESIVTYEENHPLYGQGVYASLWAEPHPKGLLLTVLEEPHVTLVWKLIQCRATKESIEIDENFGHIKQRLTRAKKKYPEIMGGLWVENTVPPTAHYQPAPKASVIIDIDVNPAGELSTRKHR